MQVFVSFDVEHDRDLYELLLEQSRSPISCFAVAGGSERSSTAATTVRRRIREADQVIVICGERTEGAMRVSAELHMARDEGTPYFLLWGRRELMCTKPVGAKPSEGMYSWTRQVLQDQITLTRRKAAADEAADILLNASRKR